MPTEKISLSLFICLCMSLCSWSQATIEKEVVSPAGGQSSNNQLSMEWTLGEIAVHTEAEASLTLCQGFHQGNESIIIKTTDLLNIFEVKAFPNPTTEFIELSTELIGTFDLSLFDLKGQLLFQQRASFNGNSVHLSLVNLSAASYILKIMDGQKSITSLKIILL